MHGQNKLDIEKALKLRAQGLGNAVIAQRLGVTQGAVYHVFRKHDAQHQIQRIERPMRRSPCWA